MLSGNISSDPMKSLGTILLGGVMILITLAVGVVHGNLTKRWGLRADVIAAGKRLEEMPKAFGDWQLEREEALAPVVSRLVQCTGSVSRVYRNTKTDDFISIVVLLGPAGPIAVHTPEICYSSREFQITRKREHWSLRTDLDKNSKLDQFWDLRLQATNASANTIRVIYGWTNTHQWQATENPRFSYSGSPFLYKLQLAGPVPVDENSPDVCADFLTAFLPVLRTHMLEEH